MTDTYYRSLVRVDPSGGSQSLLLGTPTLGWPLGVVVVREPGWILLQLTALLTMVCLRRGQAYSM